MTDVRDGVFRSGDANFYAMCFVWSGEKRPPKKGEWYLSGCEGHERCYKANNDLATSFHIMVSADPAAQAEFSGAMRRLEGKPRTVRSFDVKLEHKEDWYRGWDKMDADMQILKETAKSTYRMQCKGKVKQGLGHG